MLYNSEAPAIPTHKNEIVLFFDTQSEEDRQFSPASPISIWTLRLNVPANTQPLFWNTFAM